MVNSLIMDMLSVFFLEIGNIGQWEKNVALLLPQILNFSLSIRNFKRNFSFKMALIFHLKLPIYDVV